MTRMTEWLKGQGMIAAAGRNAKAYNEPRMYGCHYGMRSTLERDRETFYEAYDAYTPPTSFDVYNQHGLYEAGCSKERIKEMVGHWDHETQFAMDGYANDYVDVFPVCIVPHLAGLHSEGMAHIEANQPK